VRKRECGGARLGRARQFGRFRTCVGLSRLSAPTCFFRYLALVFKEQQVGGLLALLPCDQSPDLAVGHYHDEPRLLYKRTNPVRVSLRAIVWIKDRDRAVRLSLIN
jgi:hypothetical protein